MYNISNSLHHSKIGPNFEIYLATCKQANASNFIYCTGVLIIYRMVRIPERITEATNMA